MYFDHKTSHCDCLRSHVDDRRCSTLVPSADCNAASPSFQRALYSSDNRSFAHCVRASVCVCATVVRLLFALGKTTGLPDSQRPLFSKVSLNNNSHRIPTISLECGYLLKIFDSVFLNYVWMCSVQNSSELTVYEKLSRLPCKNCCEHSSLPLVLNLLFVGAVGSVSVTSTKSNKVCRLGADVPVWMLSAIVKIHVIWLLYKPLSHESYGKASIRMPEERPWAAMMTSQYAASYQVVTIPREDELEEMFLAKNLSTHPYLLGEDQFANTTCRCLTGS
ncbi:hypothetical protein T4D_4448 [Trichinella pseudospiralis]|uniref:Uncharacterized protein n=1 Tax=Trichinella pseudospiralis TaxID=6337 RepID=A0A0V1F579_TRIPS|nr:hypothetical protein T4D_4448 [Trichinella pseudospiralis]